MSAAGAARPEDNPLPAMARRALVVGLVAALAACGRKSDPLPPSGPDTPRRTYPPPEPAPTRTGMRQ